MDLHQLMRECNAKAPPSRALVKGLARELDLSESMLDRLAQEIRKDLGAKCGRTLPGDGAVVQNGLHDGQAGFQGR
jgi:hypothetical protein